MKARIIWEIDIDDENIETPRQAAEKALEIMRRKDSIATFFTVKEEGKRAVNVDLLDDIVTPVPTITRVP